jgi:hypothetical protein
MQHSEGFSHAVGIKHDDHHHGGHIEGNHGGHGHGA